MILHLFVFMMSCGILDAVCYALVLLRNVWSTTNRVNLVSEFSKLKRKQPGPMALRAFRGTDDYAGDDLYDDEDTNRRSGSVQKDIELEPIPLNKDKEKMALVKNIDCDDFFGFAMNCTVEAAIIYNSSRKAPPMPSKIADWCKAVRHLTNCAIDWNSDCHDVTDNHFREESIKGHMHVVNNICDDDWFLTHYDGLAVCIEAKSDGWEACYTSFKLQVDYWKNKSQAWTHYDSHFNLCCARAEFRRCTLDSLFVPSTKCTHEQAVLLQKYSVIVSEGDVFQDCDTNMMYAGCPGGDPRPSSSELKKLMSLQPVSSAYNLAVFDALLLFSLLCCLYYYF